MDKKTAEIRRLVYEYHIQGWTFERIAIQIDSKFKNHLSKKYTVEDARKDFDYYAALNQDIVQLTREEQRQVMIQRLQELWHSVWPSASSGDLRAVNTSLKIMERQADLLGLDDPRKVLNLDFDVREDAEAFAKKQGLSQEETERLIQEAEKVKTEYQARIKAAGK